MGIFCFWRVQEYKSRKEKKLSSCLSEGSKDGTEIDATLKHFFLDIISYHEKYKKFKSCGIL